MSRPLPSYDEMMDAVARALVDFTKPKFQHLERRIEVLEGGRQARGVGPPSHGLPAARPRIRVKAGTAPWP
jgi:hypothetical protein